MAGKRSLVVCCYCSGGEGVTGWAMVGFYFYFNFIYLFILRVGVDWCAGGKVSFC